MPATVFQLGYILAGNFLNLGLVLFALHRNEQDAVWCLVISWAAAWVASALGEIRDNTTSNKLDRRLYRVEQALGVICIGATLNAAYIIYI